MYCGLKNGEIVCKNFLNFIPSFLLMAIFPRTDYGILIEPVRLPVKFPTEMDKNLFPSLPFFEFWTDFVSQYRLFFVESSK